MLDRMKRLAVAAVVAGALEVVTSAAPAQAQEPEPPARQCATSPPLGDEWELLQTFVPEVGDAGQACRDCLAHEGSLRTGGLEYYCWEVNAFEAQLFFRSPPVVSPPPPSPSIFPSPCAGFSVDVDGEGWIPGNIFWHWEADQACENCLAQVATLEEVRRTLPGWLFEPRLYQCWQWMPNTVILFYRVP